MSCLRTGSAILCVSDGPIYLIKVGSEDIRFEMHHYCGPMPIRKNGKERPLAPTHACWRVVSIWAEQGSRTENNRALWDEPQTLEEWMKENTYVQGRKRFVKPECESVPSPHAKRR